jgi:hypothetical protein
MTAFRGPWRQEGGAGEVIRESKWGKGGQGRGRENCLYMFNFWKAVNQDSGGSRTQF